MSRDVQAIVGAADIDKLGLNHEHDADTQRRAAVTVAAHAIDARDARDLLAMLGLLTVDGGEQHRCHSCGRPTVAGKMAVPPGYARRGADGKCRSCNNLPLGPKTRRDRVPSHCVGCGCALVSSTATEIPDGAAKLGGLGRCRKCYLPYHYSPEGRRNR